jgi:hypothetical protein
MSNGIPLDLGSRLLGSITWLRPGLLLHLHAHAASQRRYSHDAAAQKSRTLSLPALQRLTHHLRSTVEGLHWQPTRTAWGDYESDHGYDAQSLRAKELAVAELLGGLRARMVWDLGANTGAYSAVAAALDAHVVSIDGDYAAVERHYERVRATRSTLPLVMDLRDPSPAHGWAHTERKSLSDRGPADAVLALALIHHLVLGAGVPLPAVAKWLAGLCHSCIVEFVPPDDPQVLRLVSGRTEETHAYGEDEFRRAFATHFRMRERRTLPSSSRVLYLFEGTPHVPNAP